MFNRLWVPVYQNSASSYDQFCVAATTAKTMYALKMGFVGSTPNLQHTFHYAHAHTQFMN